MGRYKGYGMVQGDGTEEGPGVKMENGPSDRE